MSPVFSYITGLEFGLIGANRTSKKISIIIQNFWNFLYFSWYPNWKFLADFGQNLYLRSENTTRQTHTHKRALLMMVLQLLALRSKSVHVGLISHQVLPSIKPILWMVIILNVTKCKVISLQYDWPYWWNQRELCCEDIQSNGELVGPTSHQPISYGWNHPLRIVIGIYVIMRRVIFSFRLCLATVLWFNVIIMPWRHLR